MEAPEIEPEAKKKKDSKIKSKKKGSAL